MFRLTRTDKYGIPSIVQEINLIKGEFRVEAKMFDGYTLSVGYNLLTEELNCPPNSVWLNCGKDQWYKDINSYFEKEYLKMIKHSDYNKRIMDRGISHGILF